MKTSFDLKVVALKQSTLLINRTSGGVLLVAAAAYLAGQKALAWGLGYGALIGLVDMLIMFVGIKKSLPYADKPERGVKIMRRCRYCRIVSFGSLACLMLKLGYPIFFIILGFLLTHIFYLLNLTFVTYRLNKGGEREERSVKDGK